MDEQTAKAILEQLKAIAANTSGHGGKEEFGWLLSSVAQSTAAFIAIGVSMLVIRMDLGRAAAEDFSLTQNAAIRFVRSHTNPHREFGTVRDLHSALLLLAHWGGNEHRPVVVEAQDHLFRLDRAEHRHNIFTDRKFGGAVALACVGIVVTGMVIPLLLLLGPVGAVSGWTSLAALLVFFTAAAWFGFKVRAWLFPPLGTRRDDADDQTAPASD